ncbi:hypothetical protein Tco_0801008 [Tanacetum coccineum]|uniref:Secreted protein n=1 Tax=Tanacetum coccineum TaxID=301880 RepID=A0ABQ4ZVQ0_9ASTR
MSTWAGTCLLVAIVKVEVMGCVVIFYIGSSLLITVCMGCSKCTSEGGGWTEVGTGKSSAAGLKTVSKTKSGLLVVLPVSK